MKFTRLDSTPIENLTSQQSSTQSPYEYHQNHYQYLDDLLDKTFIADYFLDRTMNTPREGELKSNDSISSSSSSS